MDSLELLDVLEALSIIRGILDVPHAEVIHSGQVVVVVSEWQPEEASFVQRGSDCLCFLNFGEEVEHH